MTYDECREHMTAKLQTQRAGLSDKGYTQVKYRIGPAGSELYKETVCRQCVQAAYNIGRTTLTEILGRLKRNEVLHSRTIGPSAPPVNEKLTAAVVSLAARRGMPLSATQIGA